ncbi:LodA/GoxA family CTQ-dependent oxidase [Streptomyces sp. MBT65]|uniref:LodA/GoxA family CTQ-dependent oxidase n=1 Tax=Streptomyces sp. MBT65 TaxID=1488395 RepID=UPI00190CB833|nr:LodA/GoxA family CTQ-dependent oxidase [Streptomyces sp. MBT65]MBK3576893.1 LodA/GoxA family CTQ-dependent oxidase [Streptomyces sp. MBT65]
MDVKIVQVKIHPAIGVGRVGNSKETPFIGPESPDQKPEDLGSYKDGSGAIRRQAARFRVYGYNAAGEVVRELKPGDAGVSEIQWTVHLANKKAAWYQFHVPLDIPEGKALAPEQYGRRNADVVGADRKKLVIDPGSRTVRGSMTETQKFDSGKIMDKAVYLGEISTHSDGRLLVLGGRGNSASYKNSPITGVTNNDTWYDDVSDGPVTAKVRIDGTELTATPAWVVVGPPHYAPGVQSVRTLYDLLFNVFVTAGSLTRPPQISFADHIEPILRRLCDLQWVNHGFATQFGWNGPNFFVSPAMRKRLADPSQRNRELRRQTYVALRDYDRDGTSPVPWPWLYGDAMASKPKSVRQHSKLSPTQDWMLSRWADGAFQAGPLRQPRPNVDSAPVAEQPGLLDRAALESCAADAFHPGCEVTWPIRTPSMFSAPFRIKHRAPNTAEPDYGPTLTPQEATAANGPLFAQGPGDLTRWMAAPWQADTASCRSGYEVLANLGPRYSPYLPTFWPAQVPNHVLKLEDFEKVNTPSAGGDDSAREEAFERRATWLRGLTGTMNEQRAQMIKDWSKLGVIEVRDYTVGDGKFPERIHVESRPGTPLDRAPDTANLVNLQVPEAGPSVLAAAGGIWPANRLAPETVEADHVAQAVSEAAEATGYLEEEIAAGYLERLDPFHEER